MTLGWAYQLRGDVPRALDCHEKVLEVAKSHRETANRSYALYAMGVTVWRQGERDRAAQLLEDGLRMARLANDPFTAATCLETLAWVAGEKPDARRAGVLMGAADALRRVAGSPPVLFPNLLVHHEKCEQHSREVLGARAFDAAYREGGAMSLAAAVGFALGERPGAVAPAGGLSAKLTKREDQVATLVAEGLSNKAIAARLVISPRTAQGHVEHILTKLGFTSRAQVAAWVVEQAGDKPG